MKTLAMVLGEFDFNDLYDAHEDDVFSRTFAMVLLVGLAVRLSIFISLNKSKCIVPFITVYRTVLLAN